MSWDIFVQDYPPTAQTVADIPDDFVPAPLGPRTAIIARILEVVPFANFADPSLASIDGPGFSIEVDLGDDEVVDGFVLRVRGGDAAAGCVAAILDHLGYRAIETGSGDFFKAEDALASLRKWRAYRDQIVGHSS